MGKPPVGLAAPERESVTIQKQSGLASVVQPVGSLALAPSMMVRPTVSSVTGTKSPSLFPTQIPAVVASSRSVLRSLDTLSSPHRT